MQAFLRSHPLSRRALRAFSTKISSSKPTIVQKFGGTSLGTPEKLEKVRAIVCDWHKKSKPLAVVSAMSSYTKSEGTTSRLLAAADAAVNKGRFGPIIDRIEDTHLEIVYSMLKDHKIKEVAREHVNAELTHIKRFLESLTVIREISGRSMDMIVGTGERLSAGVIAAVLQQEGVPAEYVNLSNIFDGLDAQQTDFRVIAKAKIGEILNPMLLEEKVPIVTGFMGHVQKGILEGIGRGYSDLTSGLVAAAVQADALQVWKESDGIFTGNPTKLAKARLVHHVTPREAAELTHFGNEVLHPYTMECTIEDNVPVHILNTFKPDSKGTIVEPRTKHPQRGIVAISSKKGITMVTIASNKRLGNTSFMSRVFATAFKHGIKVDLISTSLVNLSLTIHESVTVKALTAFLEELDDVGTAIIRKERAIISCIGEGMRSNKGLAGRLFKCLGDAGINIQMITQGANEINMSIIVDMNDQQKALETIHKTFIDGTEEI
ncbi:hypothetical protein AAMO2058_000504600 [Amorphochlora amoebiformis]|mmetsp:Transcript_32461/g.52302  ORF Transcript_32461/g.52302 Transcript_32461/m.52302 type:complete len:491 (-) Transcript_32461:244-1716(-)